MIDGPAPRPAQAERNMPMLTRLTTAQGAKKLLPVALLFSILGVAACNTVEGAGEDIQAGGEAIEETAEDVKN